ncbi:hypothetical protein KUTeg_022939 [Tegillarca granosa]|uniref:Uncharacterized protein n=1 Tax=Tegillarca granosa TaxID=220873 RepID=A0ABQ9E062_TEGGR|nr:hypothetical protein KUTeg_022939 [Tegillarca granosa]
MSHLDPRSHRRSERGSAASKIESVSTKSSNSSLSSIITRKRAKAQAEKTKLQFVQRVAQKEAELALIKQEQKVAAVEAELEALEMYNDAAGSLMTVDVVSSSKITRDHNRSVQEFVRDQSKYFPRTTPGLNLLITTRIICRNPIVIPRVSGGEYAVMESGIVNVAQEKTRQNKHTGVHMLQNNETHNDIDSSSESDEFFVGSITSNCSIQDEWSINCKVEGRLLKMQIDTGAMCNVISSNRLQKLKVQTALQPSYARLTSYIRFLRRNDCKKTTKTNSMIKYFVQSGTDASICNANIKFWCEHWASLALQDYLISLH